MVFFWFLGFLFCFVLFFGFGFSTVSSGKQVVQMAIIPHTHCTQFIVDV
jgi:hypothetical protein